MLRKQCSLNHLTCRFFKVIELCQLLVDVLVVADTVCHVSIHQLIHLSGRYPLNNSKNLHTHGHLCSNILS